MSKKTSYFLWQNGLRGPEPTILNTRGNVELSAYEKKYAIGQPIALKNDESGLTLSEIAVLYPCAAVAVEKSDVSV